MKFHPYADIFPLIDDADFDALVDDIKTHGLRERIWTYEGKILDGRNRFLACKAATIEPQFREYEGDDALAFVLSLNMQRRHLTIEQRAMTAARIATLSRGRPAENAARAAITQTAAAATMDVSTDSVQRARKVIEKGSKALQQAVESGDVPLKKAAAVVDLPKPEQLNAAKAPAPFADDVDDEPERPDIDDAEEDAALARAVADRDRRIDAILESDDQLAEAIAQLKQQAALIATLESTRDGFMRGKDAVTKMLQAERRKVERLLKQLAKAQADIESLVAVNESLRERIAIMDESASSSLPTCGVSA